MDTSGVIKINNVVSEYLMQTNEKITNQPLIYQLCLNAVRECNLFKAPDATKMVRLTLDKNLIANFPEDLLKVKKIGVILEGKVYTLTKDENIITTTTEQDGEEIVNSDYGEGVNINELYYRGYGGKGGVNKLGYYKIDYSKRRIVFRNVSRETIILLEYTTSGISLDGETLIPVVIKEYIKSFITYELVRHRLDVPLYLKDDYKKQMWNEGDKIKALTMPSMEDILDAWNRGSNSSIKR